MRRMLIFKDAHYDDIMNAWGDKLDAIGNKQPTTQAKCLDEVADEHPEWFEADAIGDPDILTGNLREQGLKILNTAELQRKKEQGNG